MNRTSFKALLLLLLNASFSNVSASALETATVSGSLLVPRKKQRIDTSDLLPQFPSTESPLAGPELQEIAMNLLAYPISELADRLLLLGSYGMRRSLRPHCNWNLLHEAVFTDNLQVVTLLIENFRFNPNEWDPNFGTAIYLVKSTQMTAKLIELGANATINQTCLMYATPEGASLQRRSPAFHAARPNEATNMRNYFLELIVQAQSGASVRNFRAKKEEMYNAFISTVSHLQTARPNANMKIDYIGGVALDYGGLTVDVINFLKKEMIDRGEVFDVDASGLFNFKVDAPINEVKLAGFIFGLSIYHRVPLNIKFVPIIYHLPFATNPLRDLNFVSIFFETDSTNCGLFENIKRDFGADGVVYEFPEGYVEDGRDWKRARSATVESREDLVEYLRIIARDLVYTPRAQVYQLFMFGLNKAIDCSQMFNYLTPDGLKSMIAGVLDYTAADFRDNTTFTNFEVYSLQYNWLIEIIDEFSPQQRAKLLKFMTALETLPIGGFGAMKETPKVEMLINSDTPDQMLPEAATCFSKLQLYLYSSKDIMKAKLINAIDEGISFGKA